MMMPPSPDHPHPVAPDPRREPAEAIKVDILIVDDLPEKLLTYQLFLRLGGHEVQVAHDGQGALEIAAAFQPELVLVDIGIPGING